MKDISTKLQKVYDKIHGAEEKYQRKPGSVTLVAVSKSHSFAVINEAILAGQLVFGESYVQEALPKIAAGAKLYAGIVWHYIGRIQSNKIRDLAKYFDWVQSVTKEEQAQKLNAYRSENLSPLNVCIEVNLSDESTKAGINISDVFSLAKNISILPRLKLRGLMAIPAPASDFVAQFGAFQKLTQAYFELRNKGIELDTLSMGMSDDFVAAIAAGSTMVRIGTAIFGPRVNN